MVQHFLKKSFTAILAAALIVTPANTNYAAEKTSPANNFNVFTNTSPYQTVPFEIPSSLTAQSDKYRVQSTPSDIKTLDDVQNVAQRKADILTSLYGETSVQYALIENGVVTVSGTSGVFSKETKVSPTEHTMYGIGSISKMFTTAAVMKLVEEGKVDLDKPVINYIPDFKMDDSRYKDITVRMLINHSSGLMGSTLDNAMLLNDSDMSAYQNILKKLSTQRLKANPGEFSVYCNDGFTLAELLVERVSGMSFSKFIADNISSKLNMSDTNTPAETFDQTKLAKVYSTSIKTALPTDNLNMIGAGGIYSSAEDLCKFSTIFMKNSSGILSPASVSAMKNREYDRGIWPRIADSTLAYGLGWDCVNTYPFNRYGITALTKGGDSMFYHSNLTVLPDQNMAIAIVSSGGSSSYNEIMAQEVLLAALKANGTISEIKENSTIPNPGKEAMPAEYKKYTGYYGYYGSVFYASISDDGVLSIMQNSNDKSGIQKFTYGGNGNFYSTVLGITTLVSFDEKINGKTYLYTAAYSPVTGLGQTAISMYQGQKLVANPIPGDTNAIWAKRSKKSYYLVSAKYSSEYYLSGLVKGEFTMRKDLPGYVDNATIIDENNAKTLIQIPGVYGRDLKDYHFYKKNNVEYCKAGDSVFASEDSIQALPKSAKFTCTIDKSGYATYYKIPARLEGKTMTVKLPEKATFIVYNQKGNYVNNSYVSGKTSVKLPEKGYVLLVGSANSNFSITIK
jgi:Beta-lactamase class C and other penicillin binding proteins